MIGIVIVTFNSGNVVESCLKALPAAAGRLAFKVLVVDNASDSEVTPVVQSSKVDAEVLRLPVNTGYCGGNNAGIRRLCLAAPDSEAILILNPDVLMEHGSIEKLYSTLKSSKGCGAVSPWMSDGSDTAMRKMRSLWGMPMTSRRVNGNRILVDRLHGACMLVDTAVFTKAGLFDEDYFLYWEEIDFCFRARKAGYRLLIDPSAKAIHGTADRDGELRRHRVYYLWRNQVHFAFKNYGAMLGAVFLVRRVMVGNIRNALTYLTCGRPSLIVVGMAGLWAGCRGERGHSSRSYASPAP